MCSGERPTSRLVTAAYSVVDGTMPAPVIMDSGEVGIDQVEAEGLSEIEIWYTTDSS